MKPTMPLVTSHPQKQPNKMTTKLYKYQLDALTWMKELEDNVDGEGWSYSRKCSFFVC
jgi:hypothetical protein